MNLPMLTVWIIALSVTFIVAGAAYSHRVKGESIGMALLTVASIAFWITGLVLGFFVNHFSSPTIQTWWWALAIRVALQVGGAIFFGLAILADTLLTGNTKAVRKPGGWIFVALCIVIGALVSLNPLRDLIEGPIIRRGTLDLEVVRHARVRGGTSIRAEMQLVSPDGSRYETKMVGWPAEKTEEILEQCDSTNDVEIIMLRQMERVLDVRCS